MDLPAGTKIEEGILTSQISFQQKLLELMGRGFTGYIIESVEHSIGIEEALLVMKKGIIIGAHYEFKDGQEEYGEKALPMALNAGLAPFGILDINALSNQQLDLIIAFQEKIVLDTEVKDRDLEKLMPKQYGKPSGMGTGATQEPTKADLFKKLGLHGFENR